MSRKLAFACGASVLTAILLTTLVRLAAAAPEESRTISHFDLPGEWQLDPWGKAPAQLSLENDLPPAAASVPSEPRQSLGISIQWPTGDDFRYVSLQPPAADPIPLHVSSIGLWVEAAGDPHDLEVHFLDADKKDQKVGLGQLTFTGWKQLSAPIPADWKQPLRLAGLTIHNWDHRGAGETRLHFGGLDLQVDPAQTVAPVPTAPDFEASLEGANGLVDNPGTAVIALRLFSWKPDRADFTIHQTLTDWSGKVQELASRPVALQGEWRGETTLTLDRFGPFTYRAELRRPDGTVVESVTRPLLRVVPVPHLTAAERADSFIGVNTHHPAAWKTLARLGIHWARDYSWGWLGQGATAPEGQGIDFAQKWREADAAGITILPVAQGSFRRPDGSGFIDDPATVREGWARLGRAFPDIPYWELDNEAESGMPGHHFDLKNYESYISNAARGLNETSRAKVVLNGTSGILYDTAKALLASPARADFAVVNSHDYTGAAPPERAVQEATVPEATTSLSFEQALRRISQLAHTAGKQSWLTEIGWDVSNGPAVGERLQAIYLSRAYLLARSAGVDKVFWYFDRDVAGSTIRFSTCGLLDGSGSARPAAGALAELSREVALARPGGSIDLGSDRYCLLFERPAGGWVAAAWSVDRDEPVPSELASVPASDLFGNPVQPATLTPSPVYFHLSKLPPSWENERQASGPSSPEVTLAPGGAATLSVAAPGAALSWGRLPEGITAAPWREENGQSLCSLQAALNLQPETLSATLTAAGAGWRRSWPIALRVLQPLQVDASPYEPQKTAILRIRAVDPTAVGVLRLAAPPSAGAIYPSTLHAFIDQAQTAVFVPGSSAAGAIPITLTLPNGVQQTAWIPPARLSLPRVPVGSLDPAGWPSGSRLDSHALAPSTTSAASVWAGWSSDGLHVAARVPAVDLRSSDPRQFWDSTSFEIFLDTGSSIHQFWLTPVKEAGGWRTYAGEWKRDGSIPATIYDDSRVTTSLKKDPGGVLLAAAIPWTALGGQPPADFRAAFFIQGVGSADTFRAGWPAAKDDALIADSSRWGKLHLETPPP